MTHLFTLLSTLIFSASLHAAQLERFQPQGEQLDIQQAVARFSAPMVALGRSDAPAPFNIECTGSLKTLPGNGYWNDEQTWIFNLGITLPAGERCHFQLKPGLTTLADESVSNVIDTHFSVSGPRIIATLPQSGATLDEDQVFVLKLNGVAQADSLTAHARCEAEGIHEQIPVQLLSNDERKPLLIALKDALYDLNINVDEADSDPHLIVLRCQRSLPANTKVALVWGAGIATASGQTNPADQRLEFRVRDHFVARMRCQREGGNAKSACIPLTPIRVDFTAPVARAWLKQITLTDGKGKSYSPQKEEHPAAHEESLVFTAPSPLRPVCS
jgi:hypothetical protein